MKIPTDHNAIHAAFSYKNESVVLKSQSFMDCAFYTTMSYREVAAAILALATREELLDFLQKIDPTHTCMAPLTKQEAIMVGITLQELDIL